MLSKNFYANMSELLRIKINTYTTRENDNDLKNFCFLLSKIKKTNERFKRVELKKKNLENMNAIITNC